MSDINKEMLAEISKKHTETLALIHEARKATEIAVKSALYCGQLVSKTQRHKKSSTHSWLTENIGNLNGVQSRGYLSCHAVSQKREVIQDKRCLQLLAILPKQPARPVTKSTKAPASLSSTVKAFVKKMESKLDTRPLNELSSIEKELLAKDLQPIAETYVRLVKDAVS